MDNEHTGVNACLTDPKFRDTLLNHSTENDYVSAELDRIGIVFDNDDDGSKRQAVLDLIADIDWSEMQDIETALRAAENQLQPLMG